MDQQLWNINVYRHITKLAPFINFNQLSTHAELSTREDNIARTEPFIQDNRRCQLHDTAVELHLPKSMAGETLPYGPGNIRLQIIHMYKQDSALNNH